MVACESPMSSKTNTGAGSRQSAAAAATAAAAAPPQRTEVLFRCTLHNTIFDVCYNRPGWKETTSESDWDFNFTDVKWTHDFLGNHHMVSARGVDCRIQCAFDVAMLRSAPSVQFRRLACLRACALPRCLRAARHLAADSYRVALWLPQADHMRICHFHNHYELTRKDLLTKNVKKFKRHLEKKASYTEAAEYDFVPTSFVMPQECVSHSPPPSSSDFRAFPYPLADWHHRHHHPAHARTHVHHPPSSRRPRPYLRRTWRRHTPQC